MLGPSLDEIAQLLQDRQNARGGVINTMRQLRDTYNGDVIIPMPEMDKNEKPAVANLITTGLDQTAMRIASTMPNLYYPPVEEGNNASEKRARIRTQANTGWWEVNKMQLLMRRRARHFVGYASTPVILRPDSKWGCAKWELRNPLDTFTPMDDDPDSITPNDVIFTTTRNRAWLKNNYPDAEKNLRRNANTSPSDKVTIAEYNDGDVTVLMGITETQVNKYDNSVQGVPYVELMRVRNRTGVCLAVVPQRISLDKPLGQFDSQVGMYELQAKLMALEVIAVERNIFPDTYLVSREGAVAKFINGPFDGRTGNVNIVSGGVVDVKAPTPNMATNQMADRLERAMRISGATPADMTGESQSNVRTGKRGDAIMSATVDFNIQEAQEVLAASLQEENKRAVAIAKSYFGNERKSFYVSSQGFKGNVDYTPAKDFENDNNRVTYSNAGADANALVVGLGQRIGIGTMSKQTAQEIDPLISDPEREKDRVISEGLQQAILQTIQAQAQQGAIPPADLAAIASYVKSDKMDLAAAITKVHEDAQKRQAQVAPPGSPETMPGLAQPGMGAEQPSQQPQQAQPSLSQLLSSLSGKQGATLSTQTPVR